MVVSVTCDSTARYSSSCPTDSFISLFVSDVTIIYPTFVDFAVVTLAKKCEAVPLQAWSGPEGARKLTFPDFMTTAQDGGKVVNFSAPAAFSPRKYTRYSFLLEAESTQGHSKTGRIMSLKNSNDTIGN
jgi:hypothetical protein